jgi:hypothetical protein
MTSENHKKSLRCKLKFHSFEKNIQERQNVCKFCGHHQKLDASQNLIGVLLGVLIFGFLSVVITLFVFETIECFEVKQGFENNQDLSREKHGFESFEQWREENGFLSNCGPKLDPGAF